MEHKDYLCSILIVIGTSIIYLVSERPSKRLLKIATESEVLYDDAKIALEKLSNWATWLTGLQTASMAAMAFLKNDKHVSLAKTQIGYGFFALLFFGSSIILSTWLVSSIPSVQQRLVKSELPTKENDIYAKRIFEFIPFTLGRFSGLIHTYFLAGIVFFALFIFSLF